MNRSQGSTRTICTVWYRAFWGGFPKKAPMSIFLIIFCMISVSWTKTRSCAPLKNRCITFGGGGGNFIKIVTITWQLDYIHITYRNLIQYGPAALIDHFGKISPSDNRLWSQETHILENFAVLNPNWNRVCDNYHNTLQFLPTLLWIMHPNEIALNRIFVWLSKVLVSVK